MKNNQLINLADLKDPGDPQGRSYREVNAARSHAFSVGQLVELENGCRLFIAKLTRDCDQTPLYSLSADIESQDEISRMKWLHRYCEESIKAITD